ncbi:MAG: hypothetical protein ACJ8MH_01030, partial [Povalibacter sp.]
MPAKRPALAGTLGAYAESGMPVFVVCDHCGRYAAPQLQLIAQQVGWRALISDFSGRMRCSRCHRRGAHFTNERPAGRADAFRR